VRILQVHNLQTAVGGADVVMDDERQMLESAGHLVRRFTWQTEVGGGRVAAVRQGADAVWNHRASVALAQELAVCAADVVHVHTPFPVLSPTVFRVAHRAGAATVASVHSYRYSCIKGTLHRDGRLCESCVGHKLKMPGVLHRCYHDSVLGSAALTASLALHRGIGTFSRHVDTYLTVTRFGRDILIRDGIKPDRITVKPNTVGEPAATSKGIRDRTALAFVGRLVEEKGIRTLLRAMRMIDDDIVLYVAGDGPLRHLVEEAARDGHVRYLGWLGEEAVSDLVSTVGSIVVPSEWHEAGPPLVMLQGLAAGTPVICSDLDNIAAGIRGSGGGDVFKPGDARSLAGVVSARLSDPAWLDVAGGAARAEYLREHTQDRALDTLLSVYDSVTGDMARATAQRARTRR
jgi:glycosyltransferase involved in cell wall biosynthesis